jgi:peptide/nickel transport system ATP-binding protein
MLLAVADLRTSVRNRPVVDGVSFTVEEGQTVGLVGESGSGKTMTGMSIAGLLPAAARVVAGSIQLDGQELVGLPAERMRAIRADKLGLVFQNPMTSLNPTMSVGAQVTEAIRVREGGTGAAARQRAVEILDLVGVPAPSTRLGYYPHQLSGGLCQRVVIGMALVGSPRLLIADEPTTALDVSIQAQILDLIDSLRQRFSMGVLLVTHDLAVIAERTERVLVMRDGSIVEAGATASVFAQPAHPYTRELLAAVSRPAVARPVHEADTAVEIAHVVKTFAAPGRLRSRQAPTRAVDDVSLQVRRGQTLGVVGESGSGKTTLARMIVGLERPDSGRVVVSGVDVARLSGAALRRHRRDVQLVFQDPYSSLDPHLRVGEVIAEPLAIHGVGTRQERRVRVAELLAEVGLAPELAARRCTELSGGQRQRVGIARALALNPAVVVADEPVSALDVSVQATILTLLRSLQERRGLTYVFISHDLSVVRHVADQIAVMRHGKVVEYGSAEQVYSAPTHPYTVDLLKAVPSMVRT